MCFAYFKKNKFERNPKEYIKNKCSFLLKKGFAYECIHYDEKYVFHFYLDKTHINFFFENKIYCTFSNINLQECNLQTITHYLDTFDTLSNKDKIDYLIDQVKNNIDLIDIKPLTKLQIALNLSKEKKHEEAYKIYEELYQENKNATNTFNLFQCAVYCNKKDIEKSLYEKLKNYSPNLKKEPMELSGCFVRFYYGIILCENKRNEEVIEIIDYLIDVISHYNVTDPTFLYIRGIPSVQMVKDLIEKTFVNDNKKKVEYIEKLLSIADEDTKKYELK